MSDGTPGKLPPHDTASEAGALGCTVAGDDEAASRLAQLCLDDVYDLRHQTILAALQSLALDNKPLNTEELYRHLSGLGLTERAGGIEYVASLPDRASSVLNWPSYLSAVKDDACRRAALRDATELKRLAEDPSVSAKLLSDAARRLLKAHAEKPSGGDLLQRLEARAFNVSEKPNEPAPRYSIFGTQVASVGNLCAISAAPKSGKSGVIGAMLASVITPHPETADCLGFESRNPDGLAVIAFDTEQSRLDHWLLIDRSLRRAGLSEPPEWLRAFCITGFSLEDARAALELETREAKKRFGGIHSVLIDGGADLVGDVNDPSESFDFVSRLHSLAVDFECSITGVIHLNPNSQKTRGHLGSQLERKAESNLVIESDEDAFVLFGTKNRRAPIPRDRGPRFAWSSEAMMHVLVESAGDVKRQRAIEEAGPILDEVFNGLASLSYSDMVKKVMSLNDKGEKTAKRLILKWGQIGTIRKTSAGYYVKGT